MSLPLTESQAVNEIAKFLYDFLPGDPHPYADQQISFAGVARDINLSNLWKGGSKLPAIITLLEKTLELRRDMFCKLIFEIVHKGLTYRSNKGNPITRNEIQRLNELIARVHFKIPELWDQTFIDSLPSAGLESGDKKEQVDQIVLDNLKGELLKIEKLDAQARGFAFEGFLRKMFAVFGLEPHSSFRLVGEQIDGSLQLDSDTYLIEAKWQKEPVGNEDILTWSGKVWGKSTWSRGLFISYSGFTQDGLEAFSRGRPTNIICMNGQDVYFILEGKMSLIDAIRLKARHAAETGKVLVTVYELSL